MIGKRVESNSFMLLDRIKDSVTDPLKIQQNLITNKQKIFMAPETYEKLKGKLKNAQIDFKKNDHFALGATMLSLLTGNSIQECYLPNGEFDHTKFQAIVTHMRRGCGEELGRTIECHLNESSE